MPERPAYKKHPLWESAMALTRAAYALAESLKDSSPDTASRLRKAAVAVPAHVAGALSDSPDKRREHVLAARGAIAEVARQAARSRGESSRELSRQAETLDLSVLFEFGAGESAR
jgi:four helix bundle protein